MAFEIIYKRLFEVEFRQNFYLDRGFEEFDALSHSERQEQLEKFRATYRFGDDFQLSPTRETRHLMAGLGLLWRMSTTGFFVGAPVDKASGDRYTLRRAPTAPVRLRFALSLSVPAFLNYTNLSLRGHRHKIYYFSNLADQGGRSRTFPFLSHTPPVFERPHVYRAGDLVRRSQTNRRVYLAVEDGMHQCPRQNPTSSSPWKRLSGRDYVTRDDRVSLYTPIFTFSFPADTVVEARFTATAPGGSAYDAGTVTAPGGETLGQHTVDLEALPHGRYRLEVDGRDTEGDPYNHTEEIYIDPDLPAQGVFGLMEIFHSPDGPEDDFSLLASDGTLRHPEYVVQFLNRYTLWRYLFGSVPDPVPDAADFDRIDDQQYVRKEVLPLTNSFIPLRVNGVRLLPNPSPYTIKPEDDRLYSDIHVHP